MVKFITALKILHAGSQVTGTFTGKNTISRARGKTGGACLIFQDTQQPQSCAVGSDNPCPNPQSAVTGSLNLFGYCVPPDDDPGSQSGTCWFKPMNRQFNGIEFVSDDSRHCLKGFALPGGPYTLSPVAKYPLGANRGVRWRVITCQNDGPGRMCNNGRGISRYGRPREFGAQP